MKGAERHTPLKMTATDADQVGAGGDSDRLVNLLDALDNNPYVERSSADGYDMGEDIGRPFNAGGNIGVPINPRENIGRPINLGNTLDRSNLTDLTLESALADYLGPFEREASTHALGIVDAIRAAFTEGYRVGKKSAPLK